jgi:uncharacterized protein YqhQ
MMYPPRVRDREQRREIATQDTDALRHLFDPPEVRGLLGELVDGVPGAKALNLSSSVYELEGTTRREARRLGETRGDSMAGRCAWVG